MRLVNGDIEKRLSTHELGFSEDFWVYSLRRSLISEISLFLSSLPSSTPPHGVRDPGLSVGFPPVLQCHTWLQLCFDVSRSFLPRSLITFSGPLEMQTGIESSGRLFYKVDIFRLEIMWARITLGGWIKVWALWTFRTIYCWIQWLSGY